MVGEYVQNFRDKLTEKFKEDDIKEFIQPSKSIQPHVSDNTTASEPYETYLMDVNPQNEFKASEYPLIQTPPPQPSPQHQKKHHVTTKHKTSTIPPPHQNQPGLNH